MNVFPLNCIKKYLMYRTQQNYDLYLIYIYFQAIFKAIFTTIVGLAKVVIYEWIVKIFPEWAVVPLSVCRTIIFGNIFTFFSLLKRILFDFSLKFNIVNVEILIYVSLHFENFVSLRIISNKRTELILFNVSLWFKSIGIQTMWN